MRQYTVTGMTCAACQSHVEKAVAEVPGVSSVAVALLTNSMAVDGTASNEEIIRAVENAGYGARLKGEEKKKSSASEKLAQEAEALADHETPKLKRRLIWSAVFLALLMYITMGHNMLGWPVPAFFDHNHLGLALTEMFLALIVMYVNKDFFLSGGKSLAHGAPNMDTLVALGSGVSFLWSLYVLYEMTYLLTQGTSNADLMGFYHDRLYFESAAMIPALITVGKTLESLSKGRTTDALKSLMRMAPKTAFIEKNGQEVSVAIDEVQPGDLLFYPEDEHVGIAAVGNGNRSRQHLLIGFVVVISLGSASILCGGLPNPSWAHARPAQKADSHVEGNPQYTKVRIQSIQIKADRIPSKRTNSGDRLTDQFRPHRTFLFPANFIWLGFSLLYCTCNYICFPVDL